MVKLRIYYDGKHATGAQLWLDEDRPSPVHASEVATLVEASKNMLILGEGEDAYGYFQEYSLDAEEEEVWAQ